MLYGIRHSVQGTVRVKTLWSERLVYLSNESPVFSDEHFLKYRNIKENHMRSLLLWQEPLEVLKKNSIYLIGPGLNTPTRMQRWVRVSWCGRNISHNKEFLAIICHVMVAGTFLCVCSGGEGVCLVSLLSYSPYHFYFSFTPQHNFNLISSHTCSVDAYFLIYNIRNNAI